MITAVFRPRHDDVLLIAPDGETFAVPRAAAHAVAAELLAAAETPSFAESLAAPRETAWSAR